MKEKLPKSFKKKWVAALRSGDYRQTKSYLCEDISHSETPELGFCCLGVACVVAKVDPKEIAGKDYIDPHFCLGVPEVLCGDIDPESTETVREKLAFFNDSGKSFNWIASYIERYL